MDPDAVKVVRRLTDHGFEAYLVGGCVRDLLLGRIPKDFDVATSATPDEIKRTFRNCRIIGRRFRLAHIVFGRKIVETSTFRAAPAAAPSLRASPSVPEGGEGDNAPLTEPEAIASPQRDPITPEQSNPHLMVWQDNVFGSAEDDARRRDFTINALFFDLQSNQVLDLVGGLTDLRAGLIRTIGDPDQRFQEDPVRILRAIKFAARLGLTIETETRSAMIRHRSLITHCSVARLVEEIYKLVRSGALSGALTLMHETGALPVLFPELSATLPIPAHPSAGMPVRAVRVGQHARRNRTTDVGGPSDDQEASQPTGAAEHGQAVDEVARGEKLLTALGLDSPESRKVANAHLWAFTAALDETLTEAPDEISTTVALAALFGCLAENALRHDIRMAQTIHYVDLLADTVCRRLQFPRRTREQLKQVLIAQRRLSHRRPRPHLRHRDYFPDALALLRLRHRAVGGLEQTIQRWEKVGSGAEARPRRRRHRRRRHPRGKNKDSRRGLDPSE